MSRLEIVISASNQNQLDEWRAYVISKIDRYLIQAINMLSAGTVSAQFVPVEQKRSVDGLESTYFASLEFSGNFVSFIPASIAIRNFESGLKTWNNYENGMEISINPASEEEELQ